MADDAPPPEESPRRTLIRAVAAMAVVAVVVGLIVGGVAVAAAHLSGIDDNQAQGERAPQSLFMPSYVPTPRQDEGLDLPGQSSSPTPSFDVPSAAPATESTDRITLYAAPQAVAPGERIDLNGVYVDGEGVQLQVQRRVNGVWTDFPVSAVVQGGAFDTFVTTTTPGTAEFRVFDAETNRASNAVTVQVG